MMVSEGHALLGDGLHIFGPRQLLEGRT
jgi:hypothetical protein